MPSLPTYFNWGSALYNENPELVRQLDESRSRIVQVVNTKISRYITKVDPPNNVTANDINKTLDIGDVWVNSTANKAWMMTSRTSDTIVNWQIIT